MAWSSASSAAASNAAIRPTARLPVIAPAANPANAAVSIMPSMAIFTTPERSQTTPESAPSTSGVLFMIATASSATTMSSMRRLPGPAPALRHGWLRRRAAPSADAVQAADQLVGGDQHQDDALHDRNDIDGDLTDELHPGRAGP